MTAQRTACTRVSVDRGHEVRFSVYDEAHLARMHHSRPQSFSAREMSLPIDGTAGRHSPQQPRGALSVTKKSEQSAPPYWKTTALTDLTPAQWEGLCDGCGKCCLQKLLDEDSGEVFYTNVACRLLDPEVIRCTDYARRSSVVVECVTLTPEALSDPTWLPATCAYRLIAESRDLPDWHPLVSGSPETVVTSGNSVRGRTVPEAEADAWEYHLVDWVE